MKILKIFGVVVGIHVFALVLIFANPGCSSPRKAAPAATENSAPNDASAATASTPSADDGDEGSPVFAAPRNGAMEAPPASFDPNAPATTVRFSPTRPGSPAAGALEAQPVSDVTPATTYTVVKGDSLWTIAKRHGISVGELTAANNIRASATVQVGQKIIIPSKAVVASSRIANAPAAPVPAAAMPQVAAPAPSGNAVRHVVRPGETLGAIARKYQVKVGEIALANNISDPAKIRPGTELTIPGWKAPAARATQPAPRTPTVAETESFVEVPTVIIPSDNQDLDAGLQSPSSEPPVIQVDQQP